MSFPASPVLNEVFIADGKAWKFDGTNWVIPKKGLPEWDEIRFKPDYFDAKVIVSDMPPTNAVEGTLWFDATNERQYTYQQGLWIEPAASVRTRYISVDPDVVNYIEAVEAADGEPLEQDVVTSLEAFILGCKVDGIWDAINSSAIFGGARTFEGSRTSLKGGSLDYGITYPLPYPSHIFSSNYDRKTGFAGYTWGYSPPGFEYLQTPTLAVVASNAHIATYITEPDISTDAHTLTLGGGWWFPSASIRSYDFTGTGNVEYVIGLHSGYVPTGIPRTGTIGFLGVSRNSTTQIDFKATGQPVVSHTQFYDSNGNLGGYGSYYNATTYKANIKSIEQNVNASYARMFFYSVGSSIDLTKLDARVTRLMTKLNAVLP